jgi:hypothetical protein
LCLGKIGSAPTTAVSIILRGGFPTTRIISLLREAILRTARQGVWAFVPREIPLQYKEIYSMTGGLPRVDEEDIYHVYDHVFFGSSALESGKYFNSFTPLLHFTENAAGLFYFSKKKGI